MDITFLQISTSSYRTTNPPVAESSALTVIKQAFPFEEPRILFQVKESRNAAERQAEYSLTRAQYDEIAALFERLRLKELLVERLNGHAAPTPFPQQCGGSSQTTLSFTSNGVTVTAGDPPQETAELTRHLQTLRSAFVSKDPAMQSAFDSSKSSCAPAPVSPPVPAPAKTQPNLGLAEGEWFCPNCGSRNNGAFCTECGTKR